MNLEKVAALAATYPQLDDAQRGRVVAARRRHQGERSTLSRSRSAGACATVSATDAVVDGRRRGPLTVIRQVALGAVVFAAVLILLFGLTTLTSPAPPTGPATGPGRSRGHGIGRPVVRPVRRSRRLRIGRRIAERVARQLAGPGGPAPSRPRATRSWSAPATSRRATATATRRRPRCSTASPGRSSPPATTPTSPAPRTSSSECYAPTLGPLPRPHATPCRATTTGRRRTSPATSGYFGARAAPHGTTWYSYDLGAWHVVMLDSECAKVGGCGADSPQGRWLAADLAASTARCTLAIWHRPRWSSGLARRRPATSRPFWQPLYAAGADLVINGHDHDYERFAPQDSEGHEDTARGIREFVVGTGGAELRGVPAALGAEQRAAHRRRRTASSSSRSRPTATTGRSSRRASDVRDAGSARPATDRRSVARRLVGARARTPACCAFASSRSKCSAAYATKSTSSVLIPCWRTPHIASRKSDTTRMSVSRASRAGRDRRRRRPRAGAASSSGVSSWLMLKLPRSKNGSPIPAYSQSTIRIRVPSSMKFALSRSLWHGRSSSGAARQASSIRRPIGGRQLVLGRDRARRGPAPARGTPRRSGAGRTGPGWPGRRGCAGANRRRAAASRAGGRPRR